MVAIFPGLNELKHWGQGTDTYVSEGVVIGSNNYLSPVQHQAITSTSADCSRTPNWQ